MMGTGIGLPDWYNIKKAGAVSALGDLGELAARLGSINTFDRRGDTVWMDGFEEGMFKWSTSVNGTGGAVEISTEKARNGGFSCKITTGSTLGQYAQIYKYIPAPVVANYGMEFSFTKSDDHSVIMLVFDYYTGAKRYLFQVRYLVASDALQYLDSAGAWQSLSPTLKLMDSTVLFNTLKLVVAPLEGEYVRALLNNQEFDMSGVACQQVANFQAPSMTLLIRMITTSGGNVVGYVDDVIVTQNEL